MNSGKACSQLIFNYYVHDVMLTTKLSRTVLVVYLIFIFIYFSTFI